jgi:hypothetical protein
MTIYYTSSSHDERDNFARFLSMMYTKPTLPTAFGLGATPMECDASDFTTTSRTREQLRVPVPYAPSSNDAPSSPPLPIPSNDAPSSPPLPIQIEFLWIVLSVSGVFAAIASYVFVVRPVLGMGMGKYDTYPKTTAYQNISHYVRTLDKGTHSKPYKVLPSAQYELSITR